LIFNQTTVNTLGGLTRFMQGSFLTDMYDSSIVRKLEFPERFLRHGIFSHLEGYNDDTNEVKIPSTVEEFLTKLTNDPVRIELNKDLLLLPHAEFEDDSLIRTKVRIARNLLAPDGVKANGAPKFCRKGAIEVITNDHGVIKEVSKIAPLLVNTRTLDEVFLARPDRHSRQVDTTKTLDEESSLTLIFDEEYKYHSGIEVDDVAEMVLVDSGNFSGFCSNFYRGVPVGDGGNLDTYRRLLALANTESAVVGGSPFRQGSFNNWEVSNYSSILDVATDKEVPNRYGSDTAIGQHLPVIIGNVDDSYVVSGIDAASHRMEEFMELSIQSLAALMSRRYNRYPI